MAAISSEGEISSAHNSVSELMCVDFPARVQNVDKMLRTLGGEETVSKTFNSKPPMKLEMKFRPDDPFCHSLYASKQATTRVLLKIKKRYKRKVSGARTEVPDMTGDGNTMDIIQDEVKYQTELVGILDTSYKFKGMCDFQYLPLYKSKTTGKMESLVDRIIPTKLEDGTFLRQPDVPLFMLPPVFSRTDMYSNNLCYQPDIVPNAESLSYEASGSHFKNVVGTGRARRPQHTILVSFGEEPIPTKPHPAAVIVIEKYQERDAEIARIRNELIEVFRKRPVWSRSALQHNCSLTRLQIKLLLPSVSYYFLTGPWRATWVRLGYDPNTEPGGLKYQMLDFRVRKATFAKKGSSIPKKRRFKRSCFYRSLPTSIQKPGPKTAIYVRNNKATKTADSTTRQPSSKEAYFIFRKGLVPAYNQMFYQLCDIHHDSVQNYIKELIYEAEQRAGETLRFLKQESLDHLRSLMNEILKDTLEEEEQRESETAEHEEDLAGTSSSALQADDMDDDIDEEDIDNDEDDEDITGDEADEEEGGPVAEEAEGGGGGNLDDDDDDSDNEMETELLEFLSGT